MRRGDGEGVGGMLQGAERSARVVGGHPAEAEHGDPRVRCQEGVAGGGGQVHGAHSAEDRATRRARHCVSVGRAIRGGSHAESQRHECVEDDEAMDAVVLVRAGIAGDSVEDMGREEGECGGCAEGVVRACQGQLRGHVGHLWRKRLQRGHRELAREGLQVLGLAWCRIGRDEEVVIVERVSHTLFVNFIVFLQWFCEYIGVVSVSQFS